MLLNCGVGEDSWESLGPQGDPTSPFWRRSALGFLWKEWCWSWNSSTLATSCEELTHWKRLWYWEGLGEGGEGDNRGWDGRKASLTRWTWVWVNSGSWWWTGRPGVLQFMGSQRVRNDWVTELNWIVVILYYISVPLPRHFLFYVFSMLHSDRKILSNISILMEEFCIFWYFLWIFFNLAGTESTWVISSAFMDFKFHPYFDNSQLYF